MTKHRPKAEVKKAVLNVKSKTHAKLEKAKLKSKYVLTADDIVSRALTLYLAELRKDEDFV